MTLQTRVYNVFLQIKHCIREFTDGAEMQSALGFPSMNSGSLDE